ncbi:ChaN family lipoprotein [Nitratidesulfovibrio liaohensis]|uniref:ChaN family lipoprotein n=1 Tax=Nitratidesulfovibrio liaohensis TaxID=2604158 RepID=A0ABY9QZL3_9BACT|nr:ChaN family lipoprotein [Nitratidesulfovibrio liaohensis]WMW64787.1 ChaN family lipoprotein [Nitratidesulfovibrio liaohensis]
MSGRGAGAFLPCVPLLVLVLLSGGCAAARPSESGGTARAPVVATTSATANAPVTATAITPGDARMGMTTPRLPDGTLVTVSPAGEIRTMDPADAARQALRHDYILLGESHTSACDHRAQAAFITALLAEGARPAIGLEMVPRDGQPALDEFSRGATPLDKLSDALDWPKTWGYDFELYRPVFAVADWARLPVHGLNVPQRVVRQVSRGGLESVPEADRAWLPPSIIAPAPEQRATLTAIFREHAAMRAGRAEGAKGVTKDAAPQGGTLAAPQGAPAATPAQAVPAAPSAAPSAPAAAAPVPATDNDAAALERFLLVQSLWDSAMAHQAVRVRVAHGGPVVILAGGGHVEFGWGIARRIRLLDPDARVLLVMPWRIAPDAVAGPPVTDAKGTPAGASANVSSPSSASVGPAAPVPPASGQGDTLPDAAQADIFWVCRAEPEPPRPMPGMPGTAMPAAGGPARPRLGLLLQQEAGGARVQQVEPGSVAERAGFRPGDLILRVGDRPVNSMRVLHEAGAAAVAAGQDVRFTVRGPGDADAERVLTVPGLK